MSIKDYIENKRKIIDRRLDRYLPSSKSKPEIIHMAMRYAVFPGGKRIRPVLTIASFEACGGRGGSILPVACAIELIHTYTLIHDDLPCMDDDNYRRGRLSCHKKFDEHVALLAGDALLTLGFQLLAEAGDVETVRDVSFAIGSCGTIGGQVVDIEKRAAGSRQQKGQLDYIAAHKTGALFEAAVKAGGRRAGASAGELRRLADFGRCVGFTFQLVDDLIDGDGHVKVYGHSYVKNRAESLIHEAKGHLSVFEKRASILSGLADIILHRCS